MSDKPIHPHELLAMNARLKKHVINKVFLLVFTVLAIPVLIYFRDGISTFINRLVFGVETIGTAQLEQRNKVLTAETERQKQQIESQNRLIEQLRKRNNSVPAVPDSERLRLPVVSPRFISWQNYQQQHPGAKFHKFQQERVEYLQGELEKAIQFFHKLRDAR